MNAKIGALAISMLMLMVAVPVVVSAGPAVVSTSSTASTGPFENAREKYQNAVETFQRAYNGWLTARGNFIAARTTWRLNRTSANWENLLERTKTALLKVDNIMIRRLEVLRDSVEATRGLSDNEKAAIYDEIDAEISWLQAKQTDIQNADDAQELRNIASDIWDLWLNIRVMIRQIDGQILSAWVDALVGRAEAFAGLVEARIQQLKDNGIDTSALENWLADYNLNLTLAEQKYDAAKDKFSQISSVENADLLFLEGVALIREGNSYLRDSLRALRDIISDMRDRGWPVTLSGSGTLIARGSGSAYISGTGLIKIVTIENSIMTVSPNAHVRTEGGTSENLENGDVRYQGFSWARVTGSDITVSLSGDNMVLYAHGRGTATLTGTGVYRTYGENRYILGDWRDRPTADLGTGETTEG